MFLLLFVWISGELIHQKRIRLHRRVQEQGPTQNQDHHCLKAQHVGIFNALVELQSCRSGLRGKLQFFSSQQATNRTAFAI